ncbi:MAG: hypothetical protein WC227_03500 [Patescibacteria group bacterium]
MSREKHKLFKYKQYLDTTLCLPADEAGLPADKAGQNMKDDCGRLRKK